MSGLVVFIVDHPHPNPRHMRRTYAKHILASKKKWGSARGLMHYRHLIQIWVWAGWQRDKALSAHNPGIKS